MLFNSYLFILLFLPLALTGYYLWNRASVRAGELWLLLMSLWFYGYFNPWYLLLIGGSILFNYGASRLLARQDGPYRGLVFVLAVICNVLLIFWFKYYDFFISGINYFFAADLPLRHILLPLGISFFTLQQISFIADSYGGKTGGYGFLEYALFVSFFPQLVAGPIVLHDELIPQFRDPEKKRFSAPVFGEGLMRFTLGLAKKMLIADYLGAGVNAAYANVPDASSVTLLLAVFAYTFQLYFDFSGYCDMAMGLAQMFGFTLPVNFDSPYRSLSIPEFWRRWHMTLGRFFHRYVYVPLGGSRCSRIKTLRNTMAVFLLSGLWHGANVTFLLWGLLHGLFSCAGRLLQDSRVVLPKALRGLVTFLLVSFLWGLFRADSVSQYAMILRKVLTLSDLRLQADLLAPYRLPYLRRLLSLAGIGYTDAGVGLFSALAVLSLLLCLCLFVKNNAKRTYRFHPGTLAATAVLLFFCIVSLGKVSVFLYFNF